MFAVCSFVFLCAAALFDVKTKRIPNVLTLPTLLVTLIASFVFRDDSKLSILCTLLILFMIGCLGACGWGDVKCMMVIACLNSWQVVLLSYMIAQLLILLHHLIFSYKSTLNVVKSTIRQLLSGKIALVLSGPRCVFGPFICAAYPLAYIAYEIIGCQNTGMGF